MNNKGTIKLETKRLILRQLTLEDDQEMFNNWASDEEVTKWLTWLPHKDIEITRKILKFWVDKYNDLNFYHWGIVIKGTNELIGTIGVVEIDNAKSLMEVGYCIGKNYWGNGYVTEALRRLIAFLFDEVNINRIEAEYQVPNITSGRVMEKVGMSYEGIFRERALNNKGEFVDVKIYSILKREYLGGKKNEL